MTTTETPEVSTSIDLAHPPEAVWETVVNDDGLSAWMGKGSSIEPWVGGKVHVADIATGVPKDGEVTSVEPERRLGLRWWPSDGSDGPSDVDLSLVPRRGGTVVVITERRCRPGAAGAAGTLSASASTAVSASGGIGSAERALRVWWGQALLVAVGERRCVGVR